MDSAVSGPGLARELSSRADRHIRTLFDSCQPQAMSRWSIVALGGYGRKEICPFSDLDILFLLEKKPAAQEIENTLKETLYPLWDAGFNASYSVRTIHEVLLDARTDFFFHTSLLDARHICGSETAYRKCMRVLAADRSLNDGRQFISRLSFHTRKRHEKFGDASYFLEPHIKDGRGGLRDHQSIVWIEKVLKNGRSRFTPLIFPADRRELDAAAEFMLKSRFMLHRLTEGKTDRLHLEYQEDLAGILGYGSRAGESPVEVFLREFHLRAVTVRTVLDTMLRFLDRPRGIRSFLNRKKCDGRFILFSGLLSFFRPEELKDDPLIVMSAFVKMAREGLSLTPEARSQIKSLSEYDTSLKESVEGCSDLLNILRSPGAENTLTSMLETGVLEQLVPEFSAIHGRTIFDVYHTHTVDLHSIHTVCALNGLKDDEQGVLARVTDLEVLYFSAFFHDIGKGYSKPHTDSGAEIVRAVAPRFGFDHDRTELAAFLVKNHLIMPELAYGRDLSEEKVVSSLARLVATPRRLSMLYLLSVADSRATGPEAWNEWKAALLRELYTRTINILEKGLFKDPENAMRLEEKWHRLIREAEGNENMSGRLWALPQAYILAGNLKDIKRHLAVSSTLSGRDGLIVETDSRAGHVLVTFITRDRPGLFSLLAGLLAINRLEIISAKIFTWYDGTVIDTFMVITPWPDYRGFNSMQHQFRDVLSGKIRLEDRIMRIKPLRTTGDPETVPSEDAASVAIDNDTSDFFTIIHVQACRRAGLIHGLSRAVSSLHLDIHRAFLTRTSDLVTGVFYVVDKDGEKLWGEEAQNEVLRTIREVIGTG